MMRSQAVRGEAPLAKPEGGYLQVSAYTLGLLWWSFAQGLIGSRAVRVGLALLEARIRRKAYLWTEKKAGRAVPELTPRYCASELATLCGLPEKRVRSALRELLSLGLLAEFAPDSIRFARSLSELDLSDEQRSAFRSWLPRLTKRHRIPVPRRALVLACESSSKALIATILGVCVRCSWLRPGEGYVLSGRVSCGWLARRFGLSIRAVQGAKEHLVALGWIQRTGNISRSGEVVAINPAWHRLLAVSGSVPATDGDTEAAPAVGTDSAGVERPSGTDSAGVLSHESPRPGDIQNPGRGSRRAEPAEEAGPGFFAREGRFRTQDPSADSLPPPRLSSIRPEDFRDTGRALELFRQAVKCGLMPNGSEHSRLVWLAAIERTRAAPARNPAGVFLHVIKNRLWKRGYLSDGHFDAANARLKASLNTPPPAAVPVFASRLSLPSRPAADPGRHHLSRPSPSKDAQLVRLLTERLGDRGHVFAALARHAGWDRERYSTALGELAETTVKSATIFQHGA
jgi:hypothetical protein